MNLKARKFFFYSFIVIFLFLGAYLVVTAQGLVFDPTTFRFLRTGGLYLNYTPRGAEVEVNGTVEDHSNVIENLFGGGTFLSNLAPGNYRIKVSYPGRFPWEKTLGVNPGVVTAASQVTLWPVDLGAKKISDEQISGFWLTESGFLLKADGNIFFGDKKIRGSSVFLSSKDRNTVVTGDLKGYYLTDLTNVSSTVIVNLPPGAVIKNWFFHPFDQNALLAIGEKNVYSVSLITGVVQKLYALDGNEASYQNGNELFVAETSGDIFSVNPLLRTEVTMPTGIGTSSIEEIRTNAGGDLLYLVDSESRLYEYDRSNQTTTAVTSTAGLVGEISPSLDDTRLAVLGTDGTLSILAVSTYKSDYEVQGGTLWKIPNSAPVSDFMWIPAAPNYGMFLENGSLVVSELGERTPQNQYTVATGVSEALIDGDNLYFIKDGSLFEANLKNG